MTCYYCWNIIATAAAHFVIQPSGQHNHELIRSQDQFSLNVAARFRLGTKRRRLHGHYKPVQRVKMKRRVVSTPPLTLRR